VRETLGLTQTECGRLFTGNKNTPYRIWTRWEETGRWAAPVDQMFKMILTLAMARDLKTPGAGSALGVVLDMLAPDDDDQATGV